MDWNKMHMSRTYTMKWSREIWSSASSESDAKHDGGHVDNRLVYNRY